MKLNKLDYKSILIFIIMIGIVCILKVIYISNVMFTTSSDLICNIIIFWGKNNFINLIWLLPILINLLSVSKKYYEIMINFNVRYKNRNYFARNITKKCFLFSFFYNFLIAIVQIVFILILTKNNIIFSFDLIKIIIAYILENTLLNFIIIYFALISNHYAYTLLAVIISYIVFLFVFTNNNSFSFTQFFCSKATFCIIAIMLFGIVYLIKRKYLKLDIGGVKNDFRN